MKRLPIIFAVLLGLCQTLPRVRRETGSMSRPQAIKERVTAGTELVQVALEMIKNNMKKIDAVVKEGDKAIKRLQDYVGEIVLEKSEYTKGFLKDFTNAKKELRQARRTLFSLAEHTKARGKRIQIMINNWDGQSKAVLKRSLRKFSALLRTSATKLAAAKTTYTKAIDVFDKSYEKGVGFKDHMKTMLNTQTAEHDAWVREVRSAYISGNIGFTLFMGGMDFLGCMLICSGIAATSWGISAGTVEQAISSYTAKLESVKDMTENFTESLKELDGKVDEAIEFLENEIRVIIKWEENAENSQDAIDDFTEDEMEEVKTYQDEIRSSLSGLMEAVNMFLLQPQSVFRK